MKAGHCATLLFLVVFAFCLQACSNSYRSKQLFYYQAGDDQENESDFIDPRAGIKPVNLSEFRFPEDRKATDGKTAYAQAAGNATHRNRLMAMLMNRSDRLYEIHVSKLTAVQKNIDTASDAITLTTASLAAVFTPPTTVRALATTAAITEGLQTSISENIYEQLLAPRLIRETQLARAEIRAKVDIKRSQPVDLYTVDDMLNDVQEYHRRGSILDALTRIANDVKISEVPDPFDLAIVSNEIAEAAVRDYAQTVGLTLRAVDGVDEVKVSNVKLTPATREPKKPIEQIEVSYSYTAKSGTSPKVNDGATAALAQLLQARFRGVKFVVKVSGPST